MLQPGGTRINKTASREKALVEWSRTIRLLSSNDTLRRDSTALHF
jgi:hypothetical protein